MVNSIQYVDTGVILRVTPRINSGGLVTCDVEQEVSSVSCDSSDRHPHADHIDPQDPEHGLGAERTDGCPWRPYLRKQGTTTVRACPGFPRVPSLARLFGTKEQGLITDRTDRLPHPARDRLGRGCTRCDARTQVPAVVVASAKHHRTSHDGAGRARCNAGTRAAGAWQRQPVPSPPPEPTPSPPSRQLSLWMLGAPCPSLWPLLSSARLCAAARRHRVESARAAGSSRAPSRAHRGTVTVLSIPPAGPVRAMGGSGACQLRAARDAVSGLDLIGLPIVDARTFVLPDCMTLPSHRRGHSLFCVDNWHAPARTRGTICSRRRMSLIAAAAGFVFMALVASTFRQLRGIEGLGLGDAKLLAAAGAWLGLLALPSVVLLAAVAALPTTILAHRLLRRGAAAWRPHRYPLGRISPAHLDRCALRPVGAQCSSQPPAIQERELLRREPRERNADATPMTTVTRTLTA